MLHSACRDAHDAACMPSTWLQRARSLPCLALTLALWVALLSVSLPASRSLFAFVRARALVICPELLACCARSDCTAPCRGAGTLRTPLLAAEAHTSATTADLSTPPPHPSPPLCSRQESSRHTGPASVARACPAARAASLSHRRKGSLVALRSARMTSRACAAGGISRLEISSIQGGRAGNCCFVLVCASPYFKPGVLARFASRFGAQVPALYLVS